MNPSTPLNGCEINVRFLLCLIDKSSYVLRSVSVHWMYQNVRIGSFFNVQLIMHYLNSFLSFMLNQKLDFSFFESFIYNKN